MVSLCVNLSISTVNAPTGHISTNEIDIVVKNKEETVVSNKGCEKKLISVLRPLPKKPI